MMPSNSGSTRYWGLHSRAQEKGTLSFESSSLPVHGGESEHEHGHTSTSEDDLLKLLNLPDHTQTWTRFEKGKQYTAHVSFSHAVNTHSLLHITLHGSRMCWCASCHLHSHPCVRLDCLFSPYSSSCSFPCVSPISSSST